MNLVLDVLVGEMNSVGEVGDQSLDLRGRFGFLERQEHALLFDGTGVNTITSHVGGDGLLDGGEMLGVHDHGRKNHCEDKDRRGGEGFQFFS